MRTGPASARFWLVTGVALAGVVVTVALGRWQLSRAAEKLALQSTMDTRQQQAVVNGASLLQEPTSTDSLYRRTLVRGTWLAGHTVFLDNRQMNGRPGFFVVTPLQLENSPKAVLVQRGWVARNFVDRARLPAVASPAGMVDLEGRIAPPPSKLYDFGASPTGVIRQNLDLEQFAREIGRPLLDVSVLQSGPPDDGLRRDWPRVNVGVDKHYGYAFQWFALGGLITLLYAWFQIVRPIFPRR